MSDITNLLYNGDGSQGTECWSSGTVVENGVITKTGSIQHNQMISISPTDTYRISFDLKVTTNDGTHPIYIALMPYDSSKTFIDISNSYNLLATGTTLASDLKNGDTTATLSVSSTDWDATTYSRLGICNNLAWGYNRATYSQSYSSRSDDVLTLKSAWAGGTISAGTKVNKFSDGSTYFYPWYLASSKLPTEWTRYSATFTKSQFNNGRALFTCYYYFSTLGYSHTYQLRNIVIENITSPQYCEYKGIATTKFKPSGNMSTVPKECGKYIRYIKDEINGSTANTSNHWIEIEAFDDAENNLALNKYHTDSSGNYIQGVVTNGNIDTSEWQSTGGSGGSSRIVDLGFVTNIKYLKIWHYWGDSRTYNDNKVSVSIDGTNWEQIYNGKHKETSSGLTIYLVPDKLSINQNGDAYTSEIIEY